jgi:hypothetical protein
MTTKQNSAPRGRPPARPDGEARTRTLGIRLTAEEEAAIVDATPPGLPTSVWLRQLALAAAKKAKR